MTTVSALEKLSIQGKHGYPATVDVNIDQIQSQDFDAVVIPGGYEPDHLRRRAAVLKVVRDMTESGKWWRRFAMPHGF